MQKIESRSVSGANITCSYRFIDKKLPMVFKRKSPDIAHNIPFMIAGLNFVFRYPPAIHTVASMSKVTTMDTVSKTTISETVFSFPPQTMPKEITLHSISK